jgi:hypothetical protein
MGELGMVILVEGMLKLSSRQAQDRKLRKTLLGFRARLAKRCVSEHPAQTPFAPRSRAVRFQRYYNAFVSTTKHPSKPAKDQRPCDLEEFYLKKKWIVFRGNHPLK